MKKLIGEKFVQFAEGLTKNYAVSNMGRVISYENDFENCRVLKMSESLGYYRIRVKLNNGKEIKPYIHKLVAEYFVAKNEGEFKVLHLNHNKKNNAHSNLKWATRSELTEHIMASPKWDHYQKNRQPNRKIAKLSTTEVMRIKKMLMRDVKISEIMKRFKISESHVRRIKKGETWGHIKV